MFLLYYRIESYRELRAFVWLIIVVIVNVFMDGIVAAVVLLSVVVFVLLLYAPLINLIISIILGVIPSILFNCDLSPSSWNQYLIWFEHIVSYLIFPSLVKYYYGSWNQYLMTLDRTSLALLRKWRSWLLMDCHSIRVGPKSLIRAQTGPMFAMTVPPISTLWMALALVNQ